MSSIVEWRCDVCSTFFRNRFEAQKDLFGCNFLSMRKFKLDSIDSTQGTHICKKCVAQIYQQTPDDCKINSDQKGQNHD